MPASLLRYAWPLRCALAVAALLLPACAEAPDRATRQAAGNASDSTAPRSAAQRRGAAIIDSARAAAGSGQLDSTSVRFRFRGDRFHLQHAGGSFSYDRTYRDSLGQRVRDELLGRDAGRTVDGQQASLTGEERRQIETTVNSVAYFALLPEPLGDEAVRPRHTGADTIRGVPYHRVAVRFQQSGGGRDWQDRFVYWFDQRDFSMDYLAYAYGLGPGEDYGTRFREAINVRRRGGVRFADYRNYTAIDSLSPGDLARYARLFENDSLRSGALRQVSTVALDSVRVAPLGS